MFEETQDGIKDPKSFSEEPSFFLFPKKDLVQPSQIR